MTGDARGTEDLDRLAQAFVDKARRGESPSIEVVATAHPDLAAEIRELFPVLALVEGLKAEGAAPVSRTHARPDQIGDYEIGCEIGRGGMGTVYEGRRVGDGDGPPRVAVKVVHAHLLKRPEYVARFLHEAAAGRRVVHENVVRTLGTGLVNVGAEEIPYILLERIDGQNLRALLREVEVVPERLCRHIGLRLANALTAVHAAGLVHRDVKPENVVITKDETVKLMDLGVAVLQDRLQRLSRTGEFVGSLLYAAPGQVAGDDPDPRWDLHALGIVLYELATGRHPARAAGFRWLRANEAARSALTHQDALAHLSPFFHTVIESLLATEDASLATAAAVRDVLAEGESSSWWRAHREDATSPSARFQRIARPTAFYGRRTEWKTLERAFAAACEGRGQVVLVEGEAGIGKSRLLYEWAAAQRGTQAAPRMVLLSHAPGEAIGDETHLAAALAEMVGEEDLEEKLARLLASRARLAPALARRLRGEAGAPEGGTQASMSFDAAYLSLLVALARERPVLLVVEDLHFASVENFERFLFFARGASNAHLLLVGTFRPLPEPEDVHELDRLDHVTHLTLEGLDSTACYQLLLEASADTPQLGESVESLTERSDRNPMFLLELVRRTRERADAGGSGETTVPDSIRGFLAARIAVLDPSDRELLEVAACVGHEFDPVLVAEASGTGRLHALKRFGRMERGHGLLRAAGRLYQFQHHLVQEVLYAELHPALRETYHAALGDALVAGTEGATGADAVTLCTHFLAGNQPLRTRPYLRDAMEHLEWESMAYIAAGKIAEQALAVEGLLAGTDRAFALQIQGRICITAARLDEALTALEEAHALVRESGDTALEADILVMLSWLARRRGRPEESVRCLERAAERARAANDVGREAVALSHIGQELMNQGHYDQADANLQQAFEALGDTNDPFPRNQLTGELASLRILQGRLEEAQVLLAQAERLMHETGDLTMEFFNTVEWARLAFRRGRFEEALTHVRSALELGRRLGMHHRDAFLLQNMGRCLVKVGRYDEAFLRFTESREIARRREDRLMEAMASAELGAVHTARGALGAALDDLLPAQATPGEIEDVGVHVQTAIHCADLLALLGRFEEARRTVDDAEAACAGQMSPPLGVGLIAARARLLEREGRIEEAAALYEEAATRSHRASLFSTPYTFYRARTLLRAGHAEEAEIGLRDALAWARESGVHACAVLAQIYLARRPDGDLLAARVALEQHEALLCASERIEAHFALWEANGETSSLEAAWRELRRLQEGAPAEDRERMLTRVDLHRRVATAWKEHGG